MTYIYFIGIDISKAHFDAYLHEDTHRTRRYGNTDEGIAQFCADFSRQLPAAFVVLEATGGYEQALLLHLLAAGVSVHRASPLMAKHFARSLRLHGKTDALDAKALACYAAQRHGQLAVTSIPSPVSRRLEALLSRRADMVQMKVAEQQRLRHPRYEACRERVQKTLEYLCDELADIEAEIDALVKDDAAAKARIKVMTGIPGIGKQTALALLAFMPELGTLGRKQAASLAGLAPHPKDSGTYSGYRSTKGGRAGIKKALFIAALAASRGKSELATFYKRLRHNGKKPIVAIIALARKIITIANARLRELLHAQLDCSW